MQLEVPLSLQDKIALRTGAAIYYGEKQLQEYTVTSVGMDAPNSNQVRLFISLKRHTLHYWMQTFIPTICLIVAALVTLYITEEHFEANVALALTSTLVM